MTINRNCLELYLVVILCLYLSSISKFYTYNVGEALILCGDGRCDSPGASAKFCSYTLMDAETNKILHTETVTREEVSLFICWYLFVYL